LILVLQQEQDKLVLAAREMRRDAWQGYSSNEGIAEEQIRDNFRSTIWTRQSSVEEWDNKIADMEERYESAKRFAAAAMDYAEKSQDHAEKLGRMKNYGEMFEISPQHKITWGSAVRFAEVKSDEYMAMAWIALDKAYLTKALLFKAKHRAQWEREWAKEKVESEDEIFECAENEIPECDGE